MVIRRIRFVPLLVVLINLLGFSELQAGILGENVVIVVNGDSVDSLTVANHYVALRDVPLSNVIVLDDVPGGVSVSLDEFRDQILKPVLQTINAKGLATQTQVVAYSAGFPTGVRIPEHTERLTDTAQKKYQTPTASINSLTYFYRYVLSDSEGYLAWTSNQYARGRFERHFINPFGGEKSQQFSDAKASAEAEDYESAAKGFEALAAEFPTLAPLRILAAENWFQAGSEVKGLEQVKAATAAGWSNRRLLLENETFAEHFQASGDEPLSSGRRRLIESLQSVPMANQGPIDFSSSMGWTASGYPVPAKSGAMPYMLSCVLAVVGPNGNSLSEAIDILERAAGADRTYPKGTFGFAKTGDVRVTTRQPHYPDAIAWLLSRNQDVEIFPSALPRDKKTYVGMMLGAASLKFKKRAWSFAPGALCENLTSLGGAFGTTSQTKLTEILAVGAAMSCGAVAEPYSLTMKFPSPMIYPYYYEGVTAIEAFYLSILSPYQMLIVGDPLCQPFARPPNDFVQLDRAPAVAPDKDSIRVTWQAFPDAPKSTSAESLEIYLLGKLIARRRPTKQTTIGLPANLSGVMDCRVHLIGDDPTKPRISSREAIQVGGSEQIPKIQRLRKDLKDELHLYVDCPDADSIDVIHLGRVIAKVTAGSSKVTLKEDQVGRGRVQIQAVAKRGGTVVMGEVNEFIW